jgi:hypothetical protein
MAGTADDNSTDEFRLLSEELSFVTSVTDKSEKLAKELLQSFLEEGERDRDGRIRYRIWQIEALPAGAPSPYEGCFWRSDAERGIRCKIDYKNSSAHWTGPASAESGRQTAEYRVKMIRLRHSAVVDFLRGVGLLPLAESEAAAEVTPVPTVEAAPPSAAEPAPPPELHGVERWVYDEMKRDPPKKGERGYARRLWERCPYNKTITVKRIQNLVGKYRKEFEVP